MTLLYFKVMEFLYHERPNHVWASDISYLPMRRGFLYLVAIMDWATRKVLAWRLSNTLRWTSVSRRCKKPWRATASLRSSTPTRTRNSPALILPTYCTSTQSRSAWTGAVPGATTSLLSGCGARSNTKRFICMPTTV
jgi:hypothetical protein